MPMEWCLRLSPGNHCCVLLFLIFYSRPSLTSGKPSSRKFGHSQPKASKHTDKGLLLSCPIRGISGGLGECYGTSPNMLYRMDSPISADTFTGSLSSK